MTGDLSAVLAAAADMAVASGDLPGDATLSSLPGLAAGTWRPVPPEAGGGPGSYATTLPFVLALANHGWRDAARADPNLLAGLNVHAGQVTYAAVATALGLPCRDPARALAD